MADRYSAKEYVDAIASEIDEAAKAALGLYCQPLP